MGIFRVPSSVRQNLATQSTGRLQRVVTNETDLRAALAALASTKLTSAGTNSFLTPIGGEIIIGAPFEIAATVPIPLSDLVLTIRSYGYVPISPKTRLAAMFDVATTLCTFDGVFCYAKSSTVFCDTFIKTSGDAKFTTVRSCLVFADQIYDDVAGSAHSQILFNRQTQISGAGECPIIARGDFSRIVGNELDNGGAMEAVVVTGAAASCYVAGNHCDGLDIDTSAGGGRCTITGNTQMGAGSVFAATDKTNGDNT